MGWPIAGLAWVMGRPSRIHGISWLRSWECEGGGDCRFLGVGCDRLVGLDEGVAISGASDLGVEKQLLRLYLL
jgi:hypothetical protein